MLSMYNFMKMATVKRNSNDDVMLIAKRYSYAFTKYLNSELFSVCDASYFL